LDGIQRRLGSRGDAQLLEDIPEMGFDCIAADVKLLRDLAVARPGRDLLEDFPLPIG
jgi:hypothetical protein